MMQTAPICIPSSVHQRHKSIDLSASWSAPVHHHAFDDYQGARLAHFLGSCTAKDVLSVEDDSHSRLVVIPESTGIEAAGASLAEDRDRETWLLLQASAEHTSKNATHKLKNSECVGLLGLEDVASFFSVFFGQQHVAASHDSETGLASPPPSPHSTKATLYRQEPDSLSSMIATNQPIASRLVSNLSGCNALHQVSLNTELTTIIRLLSQDNVQCLVVAGKDGAVCGIITALDVVSFLTSQADQDQDLADLFATSMDETLTSSQVSVISGEKSVLDALMRMRSDNVSVLAVMDPIGGFLSPVSSQEIAVEILRSSTRKIMTTPLAAFVKTLRSRDPRGTDGKDTHPAIRIGMSASMGRAASLLLTAASKAVFVLDEPGVLTTPPLSGISASPSREFVMRSLDAEPKSMFGPPSPTHKPRRYSTQTWITPRTGVTTKDLTLPLERRQSIKAETVKPSTALFRSPSGTQTHRPRSQSLAQFTAEDVSHFRQYAQQTAARRPSSQASVMASSPTSPYANFLATGYFGDSVHSGLPRHLITLHTILRAVLAAITPSQ